MENKKLFPMLTEQGDKEATEFLKTVEGEIRTIAKGAISDIYATYTGYIESDSWANFRNEMMDGFKDYKNEKVNALYDFKAIRQQIFKENREEIIKDLNQDLLEEIEELKRHIKIMQDSRY